MFKRIFLFLILNILVVMTLSILASVLGIRPYLTANGLDITQLAAFCLLWGFGGAFISLALSRIMAKWAMGVQIIDPNTTDARLHKLVSTVHRLANAAGIEKMPEVGIYDSPEINAFATGPTKNRSLVAVSTGLLERMQTNEVEGVLGHEIAHVANGDMVTMTLLQGVINAFVLFLARILAYVVASAMKGDRKDSGISTFAYYGLQILFEFVFMILGAMVVAWFSRYREFRADEGGARYAGRGNMIQALKRLKENYEIPNVQAAHASVQTLQISGKRSGLWKLFASHPPLDDRIARLSQPQVLA